MKYWLYGGIACVVLSMEIITLIYLIAVAAFAITKLFVSAGERW